MITTGYKAVKHDLTSSFAPAPFKVHYWVCPSVKDSLIYGYKDQVTAYKSVGFTIFECEFFDAVYFTLAGLPASLFMSKDIEEFWQTLNFKTQDSGVFVLAKAVRLLR